MDISHASSIRLGKRLVKRAVFLLRAYAFLLREPTTLRVIPLGALRGVVGGVTPAKQDRWVLQQRRARGLALAIA